MSQPIPLLAPATTRPVSPSPVFLVYPDGRVIVSTPPPPPPPNAKP